MAIDSSLPNQLHAENEDEFNERLANIIAHMPDNVFWMDKNSIFLGCNENVLKGMGVTREEYLGKTYSDFVKMNIWPEKQVASFKRDDEEVVRTGKPIHNVEEPPLPGKDGQLIYYRTSRVPIKNSFGEVIGIVGISRNVTTEKAAEEGERIALQKAAADQATKRALLIFSGMASHDLRTPLASVSLRAAFIKKYLPVLIEGYEIALKNQPDLAIIQNRTLKDLLQAPDDILQSIIEANGYIDSSLKCLKGASVGEKLISEEQLSDCNAEYLLRRVIDNYPYEEGQRELLHYQTGYNFNFKGNVIFFNRLIENLIKNAFEQIALKGSGEIFISCEQEQKINIIRIKDTAKGITQKLIDKLFIDMQSSKNGGTGIGLSSAKQIMHSMSGDISCQLVDNDCIEFILSFPRQ
ncbi:MAG TPA: PAS domain-containing sensor histidine kinase [Coxiellaceae bacterium]|nr:PAS domain-containing sensor histidine kinase [Coxiellaceae bacterium]